MLLGTTTRASLAVGDIEPHRDVVSFAISDDGRFVAFQIDGKSMAPGYTVNQYEIFLRDLVDGRTTVVSQTPAGAQPDGESTLPLRSLFSADARWLVYNSSATNIDPADGTIYSDLFRYDRTTGASTLNRHPARRRAGEPRGANALGISADGRYVALWSQSDNLVPNDGNGKFDVFVREPVGRRLPARQRQLDGRGERAIRRRRLDELRRHRGRVRFLRRRPRVGFRRGVAPHVRPRSRGADGAVLLHGEDQLAGLHAGRLLHRHVEPHRAGHAVHHGDEHDQPEGRLVRGSRTAAALPFHDGVLCETPPLSRTGVQFGGGHSGPADCSGSYAFHFSHAYAASEGLAPGDTVLRPVLGRATTASRRRTTSA
jgi:hypothetical protein